jgi:osmotically-inducible protein OsmY
MTAQSLVRTALLALLAGIAAPAAAQKPAASTAGALPDAELAHAVRLAIVRDPQLNPLEFRIEVDGGTVSLIGTVTSPARRARAEEVVARVAGVVGVRDYIKVEPPTGPAIGASADDAIRDEIEYELWWASPVATKSISVGVRGGVAILTGVVDTWSGREAAARLALAAGAREVVNELKVREAAVPPLP